MSDGCVLGHGVRGLRFPMADGHLMSIWIFQIIWLYLRVVYTVSDDGDGARAWRDRGARSANGAA